MPLRKARLLKLLVVIRVTMICKLDLTVYDDNDAWLRMTRTVRRQPTVVPLELCDFMTLDCSVQRHDDATEECSLWRQSRPQTTAVGCENALGNGPWARKPNLEPDVVEGSRSRPFNETMEAERGTTWGRSR